MINTTYPEKIQIGIVKLAAIGDIAMTLQALKSISIPENIGLVHWFCGARYCPLVKEAFQILEKELKFKLVLHPIDELALLKGSVLQKIVAAYALFSQMAALSLDAVFLLHQDRRYRAVCSWFYGGQIFGISTSKNPDTPIHEVEKYRRCFLEFFHGQKLMKISQATFSPPVGPLTIGVLPGGGVNAQNPFEEKRWPHWSRFLEELAQFPNEAVEKILVFGDQSDLKFFEDLKSASGLLQQKTSRFELVRAASWQETLLKIKCVDRFVSVDTGLAHLAALIMERPDQKIVTLFGPTDLRVWSPSPFSVARTEVLSTQKECSPCYANDGIFTPCPLQGKHHRFCMTDLSVTSVIQAVMS